MEVMMAWISQSPDLNAVDGFTWGPVINKVPSKIPQNLLARLRVAVANLDASINMKVYFMEFMSVHC